MVCRDRVYKNRVLALWCAVALMVGNMTQTLPASAEMPSEAVSTESMQYTIETETEEETEEGTAPTPLPSASVSQLEQPVTPSPSGASTPLIISSLPSDQAPDQPTDHSLEHSLDQAPDQPSDQPSDHSLDQTSDQPSDHSPAQPSDQVSDQPSANTLSSSCIDEEGKEEIEGNGAESGETGYIPDPALDNTQEAVAGSGAHGNECEAIQAAPSENSPEDMQEHTQAEPSDPSSEHGLDTAGDGMEESKQEENGEWGEGRGDREESSAEVTGSEVVESSSEDEMSGAEEEGTTPEAEGAICAEDETATQETAEEMMESSEYETEEYEEETCVEESSEDKWENVTDVSLEEKTVEVYCDENGDNAGDIITLSGLLPAECVAEASGVELTIDGKTPLLAYDITIYANAEDRENGIAWQPDSPISIQIQSMKLEEKQILDIYHLTDAEAEPEYVATASQEASAVVFDAASFSIYAIVEAPDPAQTEIDARLIDELNGNRFYMSVTKNNSSKTFYFMNQINAGTKIKKTAANNKTAAALWLFEATETGGFYLSTADPSGNTVYMNMDNSGNMSLSETNKTEFKVELYNNQEGKFYIYKQVGNNKYGLNMFSGENGPGFAGWTGKDDGSVIATSRIFEVSDDYYGFDGKTYGLLNYSGTSTSAAAMMSDTHSSGTRLAAKSVLVRSDPIDIDQKTAIAKDSDISLWTFRKVADAGPCDYFITTSVNGQTKYMKVTAEAVELLDEPDEDCVLTLSMGSGNRAGKIRVCNAAGYSPNLYSGSVNNGFGSWNDSGANEWFTLAEPADFTEEDLVTYTAYKVAVSDIENVYNGQKVVVYTRQWDNATNGYAYYAINQNGKLVRIHESGGTLQWVGLPVNNMLWDFTEYYYEGTTTPNNYYELYNAYSGKYISPQVATGTILSDNPIGIQLNGRKYGDYYSTILAWDDSVYGYSGMNISGNQIVASPMYMSDVFYFAILAPDAEEAELHEILPTVDHTQNGVTMKIANYGNTPESIARIDGTPTTIEQHNVIGYSKYEKANITSGLLSTDLKGNGYPDATRTGISLETLFSDTMEVNHLFSESTYAGTGYYAFDSTQCFASLDTATGDFHVYKELGTSDSSTSNSGRHGQFFPFNSIYPGVYAERNPVNMYTAENRMLSDDDPRKYERLHLVAEPDYYFGVEIDANFVQTENGRDAWGHDIIFEFTGDDDFWLYVDGELVIDLGGIHDAVPGSINYCTGEVVMGTQTYALKDIFESNYRTRNPEASTEEVSAYLADIFEDDGNGHYIFKDYSPHAMKIFYMERGGGASNLNMKFNLASVKPNTVMLSKGISGTTKSDYAFAEYAYQIWYEDAEGTWKTLKDVDDRMPVKYRNTNEPVRYQAQYTPAGAVTEYTDVYFLRAGDTATVTFPDGTTQYKVVECGVKTSIYDQVSVNGAAIEGTATADPDRKDYIAAESSIDDRMHTSFNNHVNENAMRTLTIQKELRDASGNIISYGPAEDQDSTMFSFRLYLSDENAAQMTLAYMQDYYVRDASGSYCVWDAALQKFITTGKNSLEQLTVAQKRDAVFTTSSNGTISKIPAGFSVEIRDLLVGTRFMVEERDSEIPAGYKRTGYERVDGSYIVGSGDTDNSGTIRDNSDPVLKVVNRRGFGITGKKVWTDDAYVTSHDDIYTAVYYGDQLVEGSVRLYTPETASQYYYYDSLPLGGDIADYCMYEVTVNGDTVTRIAQGAVQDIHATPKGGAEEEFSYTVSYKRGQVTGHALNAKTDTITNTRAGIRIVKLDYDGRPVAGAKFTLADASGTALGAAEYISGSDGFVTLAYLRPNNDYLTEIVTPSGYQGITEPLRVQLLDNGELQVEGNPNTYEVLQPAADGEMPVLVIKNYAMELRFINEDAVTGEPISGTPFAVYRQVQGMTGPIMDFRPINEYRSLESGDDGIIAGLDESIESGIYYLKEMQTPDGYIDISPIRFMLSPTGYLTITDENARVEKVTEGNKVIYTVHVLNRKEDTSSLIIRKSVIDHYSRSEQGFVFILEGDILNSGVEYVKTGSSGSITGTIDLGHNTFSLKDGEEIVFTGLPAGTILQCTEENDGYRTVWSSEAAVPKNGNVFTVTVNTDTVLNVTNRRMVVVPTGVRMNTGVPVVLLAISGLAMLMLLRKRKAKNT